MNNSLRARRAAKILEMNQTRYSSKNPCINGQQLEALETKYRDSQDLLTIGDHCETHFKEQQKQSQEYTVRFSEGMLGIALQNGFSDALWFNEECKVDDAGFVKRTSDSKQGVFVATVAESGQAAVNGVQVGDKLVSVNNNILGPTVTWKDVFEMMATMPRPLTVKFQRLCNVAKNGR